MPTPRFHPFTRLGLCAVGLIVVQLIMGLMLVVGSALATAWTNRPPTAQLEDIAIRYMLPLTLLSYPASVVWISYCRTHFDARSFTSLGLRGLRALPDALRGMCAGVLSIGLLWSILWLTGTIAIDGWSPEALEAGIWGSIPLIMGYLLAFMAVGFFEELLFRGYALHNFSACLGWQGAVGVQAVLFALIHLGNVVNATSSERLAYVGALPSLALIAVFFAISYRKTGSLWFPIGFHTAWNFCLGCVFSLPVSGISTFRLLDIHVNHNGWLSGGSFGAEGSFYLIPILLALVYFISKAPDHPQAILDLSLLIHTEAVPSAVLTPPTEPTTEEESQELRESRFRTKFGSAQGFSADTLQELRSLQEEREASRRATVEAEARNKIAAELSAPAPIASEVLVSTKPLTILVPEAAQVQAAPSVVVPAAVEEIDVAPETVTLREEVVPTAVATKPVTPDPSSPTAPKPPTKKPSPRW